MTSALARHTEDMFASCRLDEVWSVLCCALLAAVMKTGQRVERSSDGFLPFLPLTTNMYFVCIIDVDFSTQA
jgi:hypothetical protein